MGQSQVSWKLSGILAGDSYTIMWICRRSFFATRFRQKRRDGTLRLVSTCDTQLTDHDKLRRLPPGFAGRISGRDDHPDGAHETLEDERRLPIGLAPPP